MELKYNEFINRLTISIRLEMDTGLSDWLDVDDNQLRDDIERYLRIKDKSYKKNKLETIIEEGLTGLFNWYYNEWKIDCYKCNETGEQDCGDCEGTGEGKEEKMVGTGWCNSCSSEGIIDCQLCDGEINIGLFKAMIDADIPKIKENWLMTELNSNWSEDNFDFNDDKDDSELQSYYDIL